jgi:hypothetical protein
METMPVRKQFEIGMATVIGWDMAVCWSEISLISFDIRPTDGLFGQPELVGIISMFRIFGRKKQSTWTASRMHVNFFVCVSELPHCTNWNPKKINFQCVGIELPSHSRWTSIRHKVNFRRGQNELQEKVNFRRVWFELSFFSCLKWTSKNKANFRCVQSKLPRRPLLAHAVL